MKTRIVIAVLVIALIAAGVLFYYQRAKAPEATNPVGVTADPRNGTYMIEGFPVTLANGHAETPAAPDSASTVSTQYFGNDATGDLNGDGRPDKAFLITQSGGGSGTFYYVVAALATGSGYAGTNAVFLGDRIAPQTTQIANGVITVNYADRPTDAPMSAAPSVGVSRHFMIASGTLVEAGK